MFRIQNVLVIALLLGNFIFGSYGAGYGGASFRYGVDARQVALAGAMVAEPQPGFNQFANPALITTTRGNQVGMSFFFMSLDRSIQVISYNRFLPPKGAVGLAIYRAGINNIQGRDLAGHKLETYETSDMYGMLSFGLQFTDHVAGGFNVRAFYSELTDDVNGSGIALDAGVLAQVGPRLKFGLRIENLLGQLTWNEEGGNAEDTFPSTLSVGGSFILNSQMNIMAQWDMVSSPDQDSESRLRTGIEGRVMQNAFWRVGFSVSQELASDGKDTTVITPVLGAGFDHNLGQLGPARLDYALDLGVRQQGLSHLFTWYFSF